MSLVKARELFVKSAFPVAVDTVVDRTLIQKELHRHEYFEMLFVERGTLTNRFENEALVMKPGDLLIMKPYVLHVLEDARKHERRMAYCCSFLPQAVDSGIQSLDELKATQSPNKYFFRPFLSLAEEGVSAVQFKVPEGRRGGLLRLFQQLRNSAHEYTDKANALTRCHLLSLLEYIAEQYEADQRVTQISTDLAVSVSRYQPGLRKALNHIHDHFDQPLTLEEMATMSGASETYFCRLFKHETGLTFLNYLNGLRIERAKVLLRDTCDNAADICYQVGFSDYTHFGRQFKKHTGMSPADFRKQSQQVRPLRESVVQD
jgi:AraC-like DNA-binding protein/mannose-6-phosphate isomerase-like protein (cupin superfamily)